MSEPFVLEESFTTGNGDFTLEEVVGYQSFASAFGTGSSNTFEYGIRSVDFTEWEQGTGYMSDSSTLVRDTVNKSSNQDNHVDFSDPNARKVVTNALDPEDVSEHSNTEHSTNLVGESSVIKNMTEETSPADDDVFILEKDSDGSARKVKSSNLPGGATDTATYVTKDDETTDLPNSHSYPIVNVEWEGAAGDGTTDDTASIHSARDTAGTNGTLYFPDGTYSVTGLTANTAGQNWILSAGATIKLADGQNSPHVIQVTGSGVSITGEGTIDGNKANNTAGSIIFVDPDLSDVTVRHLELLNSAAHGVRVKGTSGPTTDRLTVRECKIDSPASNGIYLNWEAPDANLIGNNIVSPGDNGIAANNSSHNLVVKDNRVVDAGRMGVEVVSSNNCLISDNRVENPADFGISIAGGGDHCSVVGNVLNQVVKAGVEVSAAPYTTVIGNTVEDSDANGNAITAGIVVAGSNPSNGTIISGNTIDDTEGDGIDITGGTVTHGNLVISGNTIDNVSDNGIVLAADNSEEVIIANNNIEGQGTLTDGIHIETGVDTVDLINNQINNVATNDYNISSGATNVNFKVPDAGASRMTMGTNDAIASGTGTTVNFDTTDYDKAFGVTANTGNTRFDITQDGTYRVKSAVLWNSDANWSDGDGIQIQIRINGANEIREQKRKVSTSNQSISVSGIIDCSAGDNVEVRVLQDSGNSQTVVASDSLSWFDISRVGS